MAKRPAAGRVKRRLARRIGTAAALRFYRAALFQTVARLGADPRWQTYLAVSPDTALADGCWPAVPNVVRVPQGPGDLGARMQNLLDTLPPGPAIVIGSDIPAVRASHIADAFKTLGQADAVFGPAHDGGYWLAGFKRGPRRLAAFEGVPWSTGETLAATLANLRGRRVAFAATLCDVDTVDDYRALRETRGRLVTRSSSFSSPRQGAA